MTEPLLRMTAIGKSFPGVQALDEVGLEVGPGEVHALLGENGAGKSTLLKILAGAQQPDAGRIAFAGRTIELVNPIDAQRQGIVTIYQEFTLLPHLSVAENVFIGREPTRGGFVAWRELARRARELIGEVGLDVNPMRQVSDLSVAEQQMVEIARALSMEARLVVMDEPTSALSEHEVGKLFGIIRSLKARGISVIFVTHRLDEVMQICDQFTVLRDGHRVGGGAIADTSIEEIIRLMVGREVERLFRHRSATASGSVALRIEALARVRDPANPHATVVEDATLEVRHGEILGLAGLVGAGRTELARAIFGADPVARGRIFIDGNEVAIRSPLDAIRAGVGLVPEDRKQQALFLALAVRSNLSITVLDRLCGRLGLVDGSAEEGLVEEYRQKLNIKMAGAGQAVANLSGGNQQKVVLARWLALQPKVLIVDEPTRGIDVAAKAEVHQLLYQLADSGVAVIAISSELPEVLTVSDRIVTMCEGRITGEVAAVEASEEHLMRLMTRGSSRAA